MEERGRQGEEVMEERGREGGVNGGKGGKTEGGGNGGKVRDRGRR